MRIVVTGGSGKGGTHVVRDLREHGHEVLNVDARHDGSAFGLTMVADLTDLGQTQDALSGFDAVVHFAAIPAPGLRPDGETFRINLKVYTTPELTRYSRKWDRAWVPYTVLGGGVAFVAAGGILQALAQSDYDKFNQQVRECDTPTQGCVISEHKEITAVRDSADSKRTMGFVGYGIGAAAIATGAVLAYINRSRPYQITPEELEGHKASGPAPMAVVPIVSPEVMGATVQGHF